jgi:hypothetical protein
MLQLLCLPSPTPGLPLTKKFKLPARGAGPPMQTGSCTTSTSKVHALLLCCWYYLKSTGTCESVTMVPCTQCQCSRGGSHCHRQWPSGTCTPAAAYNSSICDCVL